MVRPRTAMRDIKEVLWLTHETGLTERQIPGRWDRGVDGSPVSGPV